MACGCGCGFAGGGAFASGAIMSSMMSHPWYGSTSTYHSYREDHQALRPQSMGYHCAKCGQPTDLVGDLNDSGLCKNCKDTVPTVSHIEGKIVENKVAPVMPASTTTPKAVPPLVTPINKKPWWKFWK